MEIQKQILLPRALSALHPLRSCSSSGSRAVLPCLWCGHCSQSPAAAPRSVAECGHLEPSAESVVPRPAAAASLAWSLAVGRCRFYYYSGPVGPTDQEIVAIDKVLCYGSKEEEACCVIQGHTGSTWVSQAAEEMGKAEARAFTMVSTGRNR